MLQYWHVINWVFPIKRALLIQRWSSERNRSIRSDSDLASWPRKSMLLTFYFRVFLSRGAQGCVTLWSKHSFLTSSIRSVEAGRKSRMSMSCKQWYPTDELQCGLYSIPDTLPTLPPGARQTTGCPPVSRPIRERRFRFFEHVARAAPINRISIGSLGRRSDRPVIRGNENKRIFITAFQPKSSSQVVTSTKSCM